MLIVCPQCGATNRVPESRISDQPVCGRCAALVLPRAPIALSDERLGHYLAKTDMPVLVDFWAEWCGPCQAFAPQFAQAAGQRPDLRFVKVDSDASPQASAQYAIRSIPTVLLFHKGREIARSSGAMSAAQLLAWVNGELSRAP